MAGGRASARQSFLSATARRGIEEHVDGLGRCPQIPLADIAPEGVKRHALRRRFHAFGYALHAEILGQPNDACLLYTSDAADE